MTCQNHVRHTGTKKSFFHPYRFLGLGAGYRGEVWRRTLVHGTRRDYSALERFLAQRYSGNAILCKNGRTALCMALQAYFHPGDAVIVNGFTCYAVVEAIKAAGLTPVYADISPSDLNFTVATLEAAGPAPSIKGIIIQNSLGNPVDIAKIEQFAEQHDLLIIEDLAHCAGVKYPDGREAGTVGAAAVLSFGKEKMIDATSGGAVVLRRESDAQDGTSAAKSEGTEAPTDAHGATKICQAPSRRPKPSDYLRDRFYPLLSALCRILTPVHLGGPLMRAFLKIHWVERSADNRLDLTRKMPNFEAKLALEQLKSLRRAGMKPVREFFLLENREEVLAALKKQGYFFDGFWYEKPVSPARYYSKVHFPEENCPLATEITQKIINFPTYYRKTELKKAYSIVEKVGIPWHPSALTEVAAETSTEVIGAPSKVPSTGVKEARPEVPQTEVEEQQ